jgi:hypothetical protein
MNDTVFTDTITEEGFYFVVSPSIPNNYSIAKATYNVINKCFNVLQIHDCFTTSVIDPNVPGMARFIKIPSLTGEQVKEQLAIVNKVNKTTKIKELYEEIERLKKEDD